MSDLSETLAQLDRRLGDIRQQIASLTDDFHWPAPGAGAQTSSAGRPPRGSIERPDGPAAQDRVPGGEDLLAGRDRLLTGDRELVRAYERQLEALEKDEPVSIRQASPPGVDHAAAPLPAVGAGITEQSRPAFFEGTVTVVASEVRRLQTIQVLEDALSRLRHVRRAYVRRCHHGQVWIELTLTGPSELIGELNRAIPFPFAVQAAGSDQIAVSLEGEL